MPIMWLTAGHTAGHTGGLPTKSLPTAGLFSVERAWLLRSLALVYSNAGAEAHVRVEAATISLAGDCHVFPLPKQYSILFPSSAPQFNDLSGLRCPRLRHARRYLGFLLRWLTLPRRDMWLSSKYKRGLIITAVCLQSYFAISHSLSSQKNAPNSHFSRLHLQWSHLFRLYHAYGDTVFHQPCAWREPIAGSRASESWAAALPLSIRVFGP